MRRAWALPICALTGLISIAVGVRESSAQGKPQNFWTLGIYSGPTPFRLLPGAANPVLTGADVTDMNVDTLAHPFMIVKDKRYYVFFTAKDLKSDKGGIGLAESSD